LERLGQPGDKLREKLQDEQLVQFEGTSRLAQQIIRDRPLLWEYKLAAELLRTGLGAIYQRWEQLKQGMYVRKSVTISASDLPDWLTVKFDDLSKFIQAMNPLLMALNTSFGPRGQPGNDSDILTTCNLIIATADNFLEWEEDVRFAHVDERFREILSSLQDIAGRQLDQLLRIPNELYKILAMEKPEGLHEVNLVFTVPQGFADTFNAALDRTFKN
jgi:hypothetical protein